MEDCRLRPWRRTTHRDASSPPLPQHPSPLDVLELNRRSGSYRRRRQVTLALYLLATGTHKVHRRGISATPLWPSARNGPIIRLANQNPLPDLKMPDRNPQHSFMVLPVAFYLSRVRHKATIPDESPFLDGACMRTSIYFFQFIMWLGHGEWKLSKLLIPGLGSWSTTMACGLMCGDFCWWFWWPKVLADVWRFCWWLWWPEATDCSGWSGSSMLISRGATRVRTRSEVQDDGSSEGDQPG